MTLADPNFPARYEPVEHLGEGGSGAVWAARDRVTQQLVALKLLRENAPESEIMALVREATALSGMEGLGVPRVLHFGRVPATQRVYLVRELVVGTSLAERILVDEDVRLCVSALLQAADLLTTLHRALLFHGDIKPANIIVGPDGTATLVDLGLAAPWRDGGTHPIGLTPHYAAPELFRGEPLTAQGEVFALGVSLADIIETGGARLTARERLAVGAVIACATKSTSSDRYPSVDEFAEALRSAMQMVAPVEPESSALGNGGRGRRRSWSVVGQDALFADLLQKIQDLGPQSGLLLGGPKGSGRTTLLRRIAWALGVAGASVIFVEAAEPQRVALALDPSMVPKNLEDLVLLVDEATALSASDFARMDGLRAGGARLVAVVGHEVGRDTLLTARTFGWFEMLPLEPRYARNLVRRFMPSLADALVEQLLTRSACYPGPLRALIERLEARAIVSLDDLDSALDDAPVPVWVRIQLTEIHRLLDRGRIDVAADYLALYDKDVSVSLAVARAKVATGRGDPKAALMALAASESLLAEAERGDVVAWCLQRARAHLRVGDYDEASANCSRALASLGTHIDASIEDFSATGSLEFCVDALAVTGLSSSFSGRHAAATDTLEKCVSLARSFRDPRVLAIALGSLAFALQRSERLNDAEAAHAEALEHAQTAGDAGHIATTRLNLATIAHTRGDFGTALEHLEAAVDMGRRSGRVSTVRQALLNLASMDLYLGRRARAEASLDTLAKERNSLSSIARAQLLALEAESFTLVDSFEAALDKCAACAAAYEQLGRSSDAAEALFERVLIACRAKSLDALSLQGALFAAEAMLGDSGPHRPLAAFARGKVAVFTNRLTDACSAFDEAVSVAETSGQRDWLWRALVARAELHGSMGHSAEEARDRQLASACIDAIAAPLPPDLREVFWSDPRRRAFRRLADGDSVNRPFAGLNVHRATSLGAASSEVSSAQTELFSLPRSDQLVLLLEINRELAGEYDLSRLLERVTDRAITLLNAECGFVLLRSRKAASDLSVHAARGASGEDVHALFSRSIAEQVISSGVFFLAVDAPSDERVADVVSVHNLRLRSVACVPIRARQGGTIGALYVETRLRAGVVFGTELTMLVALAEQAAIAIEAARLIGENREHAAALEASNRELLLVRAKLEEVLDRRTEQLDEAKRSLRTARAALRSHFGYGGIVGTSVAMRRVYSVIDRLKDADVPVLLTGESGTGKEVIARTIHGAGVRSKQKFVGVNCAAIPEHLLESELFGHEKGAFTGAERDKKGLFRELDGGTLLLDEIGEMPPKMQAGLLRVLQEGVVRPVGGTKEERVDVRVIAATHRNLAEMVERGTFREDLFYRLNVVELRLPALRERPEDVPLLVDYFLGIFAGRYRRERRTVSREALRLLQAYPWPGNVRQLENVLLNAWIISDEEELGAADFQLPVAAGPLFVAASATQERGEGVVAGRREGLSVAARAPESAVEFTAVERAQILEALQKCNWNRSEAARLLGIPRRTFYRRLERHGIQE